MRNYLSALLAKRLYHGLMMAVCLIVSSCFSSLMLADEDHNAILNLDARIYDVKGVGEWSQGSRAGQVRLVITRQTKQDKAYLQWVEWQDGRPFKVRSTIPVAQVNDTERYTINFIRKQNKENEKRIILGLESTHTKETFRAVIRLDDVGLYQCEIVR